MNAQIVRVAAILGVAATMLAAAAARAHAAPLAHGDLLHIAKPRTAQAAQSNNWFGYNQGTLEQGGKQFNAVTGDWIVPTATQHTRGQEESSSDWIGIGGGCIDAGCTIGDTTLIQTGTEQDVAADGTPSYSAWWEAIPTPSITISDMSVHPGDHMHASVAETAPGAEVWNVQLTNVTTGRSFSTTIPYPSTHATAEWIEETPLVVGTGGAGLAALPNLSDTPFTSGTTNGANAGLQPSEQIQLVDANGSVIGTPSAPNATADGFTACAWATSC
jgi:hypothetical protein